MIKIEVLGNLADNARVIRDNAAKPFRGNYITVYYIRGEGQL